jgi:hypothetical protein
MAVYDRYPAHLLCHIHIDLDQLPVHNSDDEEKYNNEDAENPNFPIDWSADAERHPRCLT